LPIALVMVSVIGLTSSIAFGSLYQFSAVFPVIVNAFLFIGVSLSTFIALFIYLASGFEVHPTPNQLLYYFEFTTLFVLIAIVAFVILLCDPATTYYLTPSIDLEERISFIEAEGGEHFSMKNFGDLKASYSTRIPVHKIIWTTLFSVSLSMAISIIMASFYPDVPNSWGKLFPLPMWLVFAGFVGDLLGRECSLFMKHLVRTPRRLLFVTTLRVVVLIGYFIYIYAVSYKNNWVPIAIVLLQSFLGGFSTTAAYSLGSAAVDLSSKSHAVTLTTSALMGGVFVGVLISLICLLVKS